MVTSPWPAIGSQLDEVYQKEYLFHQSFENDNFMDILIPPQNWRDRDGTIHDITNKFFGTKMLNIFIAMKSYGWELAGSTYTFRWNDPDSAYSAMIRASAERWALMYPRYPQYTTLVYVDLWTAGQIEEENPGCGMVDRLTQLGTRFDTFCSTEVPGFEYRGFITEQVEENFFEDDITEFYGTPRYKRP